MGGIKQCMTDSNEAQPTQGMLNDAQQTQMKHDGHWGHPNLLMGKF